GQPKRAVRHYERVSGDLMQWVSDALLWTWRFPHGLYFANALLANGDRQRALRLLDEAERLFERLAGEGLVNPELDYERALVLALRAAGEAAAAALGQARERGWRSPWLARRDPPLAEPRARNLLPL